MGSYKHNQEPIVLVVDFNHAKGPDVEFWFCDDGVDPVKKNDWTLLPFMALTDGAHTSTEDFSYFTLQCKATEDSPATSLFGISCTRQMDSEDLINRPAEVTRSTVQKAVVIIINEPRNLGQLREKLSMVTSAWFAQRDFSDTEILQKFWEGLKVSLKNDDTGKDQHLGLSLREMIHEFKHQTLVLFKCLLLQPKMLFFGSRCERLCMIQFSLISLIPGLIHRLEDCADPSYDSYAQTVEKPSSLKTSERSSLLAYMGLPLQIFGKGSMFGPYTPLQQLDLLADYGTKSYVVGSTNSLLLQQKDKYSDILINLDEDTISISSPSLRSALSLSAADRRWIDFLTQAINETWDEAHPGQPKTHGYIGSEEFIRLQFEEYLLALLSCMKYHDEIATQQTPGTSKPPDPKSPGTQTQAMDIEGDPALDFNIDFLEHWRMTSNFVLFNELTSGALLFSIVEPRHPCAGGLGFEDIQRRLAQQVSDLHLDERVREGRETLNKHLATGQKKVTTAFNSLWADIEARREAQRKRNEEKSKEAAKTNDEMDNELRDVSPSSPRPSVSSVSSATPSTWSSITTRKPPAVDLSQAQANVAAAGQRASAYFSSWGSWASDRRKEWQTKQPNNKATSSPTATPRASTTIDTSDGIKNGNNNPSGPRDISTISSPSATSASMLVNNNSAEGPSKPANISPIQLPTAAPTSPSVKSNGSHGNNDISDKTSEQANLSPVPSPIANPASQWINNGGASDSKNGADDVSEPADISTVLSPDPASPWVNNSNTSDDNDDGATDTGKPTDKNTISSPTAIPASPLVDNSTNDAGELAAVPSPIAAPASPSIDKRNTNDDDNDDTNDTSEPKDTTTVQPEPSSPTNTDGFTAVTLNDSDPKKGLSDISSKSDTQND